MILRINYLDNEIRIENDKVMAIEIENKKYFYRVSSGIYNLSKGETVEEFQFCEEHTNEMIKPNIQVINDFFNLDLDNKKVSSELQKDIISEIDERMMQELVSNYKKIYNSFNKILNNIELPIIMDQDFDPGVFIKALKVSIQKKDELLDNLLLWIDIEKVLNIHDIIFFINLKQYLTSTEILELYKYAIYNGIKIVLIDSQCYGTTLEYEKKIIIDENLDEFVL